MSLHFRKEAQEPDDIEYWANWLDERMGNPETSFVDVWNELVASLAERLAAMPRDEAQAIVDAITTKYKEIVSPPRMEEFEFYVTLQIYGGGFQESAQEGLDISKQLIDEFFVELSAEPRVVMFGVRLAFLDRRDWIRASERAKELILENRVEGTVRRDVRDAIGTIPGVSWTARYIDDPYNEDWDSREDVEPYDPLIEEV